MTNTGVVRWVQDPLSLPLLEQTPSIPDGWTEHTVEALTVAMPSQVQAHSPIQHGLVLGERPGVAGAITHHLLPASSPYPITRGQHVVRVEVPGAELAVAEVDETEDGTTTVTLTIHGAQDQYRAQLTGIAAEQAEEYALGLIASARLAS